MRGADSTGAEGASVNGPGVNGPGVNNAAASPVAGLHLVLSSNYPAFRDPRALPGKDGTMDDTEVWAIVDERRQAVVDLLGGLAPGDWDRPSLCAAWSVREVAAHLTLVALPRPQLIGLFVRYPGSMNRTIRDASKARARRMDNDEIRAAIRSMIGLHRHFPGLTCREALVDILGHTLDIALPLQLDVQLPTAAVAEAANRVVSYGGKGNARVFRPLPVFRFRLTATDHDWSTGSGPEVTGTMTDLYLALIGRSVHLDRLGGEGAESLRNAIVQPA